MTLEASRVPKAVTTQRSHSSVSMHICEAVADMANTP